VLDPALVDVGRRLPPGRRDEADQHISARPMQSNRVQAQRVQRGGATAKLGEPVAPGPHGIWLVQSAHDLDLVPELREGLFSRQVRVKRTGPC